MFTLRALIFIVAGVVLIIDKRTVLGVLTLVAVFL